MSASFKLKRHKASNRKYSLKFPLQGINTNDSPINYLSEDINTSDSPINYLGEGINTSGSPINYLCKGIITREIRFP